MQYLKTILISITFTISNIALSQLSDTQNNQISLSIPSGVKIELSGEVEVEFIDVVDVKFLGRKIEEGYQEYQKFKGQMLDLGINVDELIDNAGVGIVTTEEIPNNKINLRIYFLMKRQFLGLV